MNILAHRGAWHSPEEKNSLHALNAALNRGWGIETDIRDYKGELVIAHDPADEGCIKLETVLSLYSELEVKTLLALNVKADGLYLMLENVLKKYNIVKCLD